MELRDRGNASSRYNLDANLIFGAVWKRYRCEEKSVCFVFRRPELCLLRHSSLIETSWYLKKIGIKNGCYLLDISVIINKFRFRHYNSTKNTLFYILDEFDCLARLHLKFQRLFEAWKTFFFRKFLIFSFIRDSAKKFARFIYFYLTAGYVLRFGRAIENKLGLFPLSAFW